MILNQAQAEAVYSAMCALNNVGAKITTAVDGKFVFETSTGLVLVDSDTERETYAGQFDFATAYNLS